MKMDCQHSAHTKGFTLIELMIATAIIGIIALIALPNFVLYRDRGRVARAVSTSESIRSALASYAADAPGNAYPGTISTYAQLRSISNANGSTLPSEPVFSILSYSPVDKSGDGLTDDYSMRLTVHLVSTPRLGGQILVTPRGVLRCIGTKTAQCR